MRLMSIKYPNGFKLRAGESIEQELFIQNDGVEPWPADSHLVFAGTSNPLELVEEIFVGPIAPQDLKQIFVKIKMPKEKVKRT